MESNARLPYSLVGLQHAEILDDVRRLIDPEDVLYRTVFDLDEVILSAARDIQQCHHNRSVDSRPSSPRLGRVAVSHSNPDSTVANPNIIATATPYQQQLQQQQPTPLPLGQPQLNQANTPSTAHTSQSVSVSNHTLSAPDGLHNSPNTSLVPNVVPISHVADRCDCDRYGDSMLTNEDEIW